MENDGVLRAKEERNDVIVEIHGSDEGLDVGKGSPDFKENGVAESGTLSNSNSNKEELSILELTEQNFAQARSQMKAMMNTSTGVITSNQSLNQPTQTPSESSFRRRPLFSSVYSKPKSRILEPTYTSNLKPVNENTQNLPPKSPFNKTPNMGSPLNRVSTGTPPVVSPKTPGPITPKTPLMAAVDGDDSEDDDDDEVYKSENLKATDKGKRGKKVKLMIWIEWIVFVGITVVLICSLTVTKPKSWTIWSLELWKWCVVVLVIFCGRLFTEWLMNILVFFIETNFLLKKKVLYFVYGMKKGVRVVFWLGLILLAWALLINRGVRRSEETKKTLNYITRGIASSLIAAVLWAVKTLLIKLIASSFQARTYFDRIQESIFHQYILQVLSGAYAAGVNSSKVSGQLSFTSTKVGKQVDKGEEVINVDKLYKMKREKVSAWTLGELIKVVRSSRLSTVSAALDESADDEFWGERKEITSEVEAMEEANRIFRNVVKHGHRYIEEGDLLRFMPKEEVDNVLPLFEGAMETRKIKKSSFRNWVVKAYNERKCLANALNDAKTAIEELNRIASVLVLVVIIIVWLLLMEIATTKVLVFISSQLLLVVFMFGNSAKVLFEAIIFVFVVHPFDVGDRCVIDGIQMVVEEMNILTTIFLKADNEKIYYPNSVLAMKPISNFNRSPEMGDTVEFTVDFSTSAETIATLKTKIKEYIDSKPQHWRPDHSVQIKEIEDVNKLKMALYVTHTINFQNSAERGNRRSNLVFELKKIFEGLSIKYQLLPQEVHIKYVESESQSFIAAARR